MKVRISEGPMVGTIRAVPSKSQLLRYLICAALAEEETRIVCHRSDGDDVQAAIACLRAIGADIKRDEMGLRLRPLRFDALPDYAALNCGESGAVLRFLLPLCCSLGLRGEFRMGGRLPARPIKELERQLSKKGCALFQRDANTLRFAGKLRSGIYQLTGEESSQFLSGLLLALPRLEKPSEIQLDGPVVSRAYVDMTLAAQRSFGITIEEKDGVFYIPGGQRYRTPQEVTVEGDWANAAFWLCGGAMSGGRIRCQGLSPESRQAERVIERILREVGADVRWESGDLLVSSAFRQGLHLDAGDYLDIVPALAALAALSEGRSTLRGLSRLRLKESDRLRAIVEGLTALGATVEREGDDLRITGQLNLPGGSVSSFGDHRIAMMAAVASAGCRAAVTVTDAQAVAKSDPQFWEEMELLGKEAREEAD